MEKIDFENYAKKSNYYSVITKDPDSLPENIKFIINKCKKRFKKISILDMGCGDGGFLELLANNNLNVSLYASDISKIRLDRTKEKLGKKLKKTFLDDASSTKIRHKFQFINSDQVIEHTPSDIQMVQNIKKLLNKKGLFKVSSVYKTKYAWYFYRCNNKWVLDPTHVREYENIDQFKEIFIKNGLKVIKVEITPIHFSGVDFILRRAGIKKIGKNLQKIKNLANKIKIQKPGYYTITIIGEKP